MVTEQMKLEIAEYLKANPDKDVHASREYLQYEVFWKRGDYCTNAEVFDEIQAILNPPVLEEPVTDPDLTVTEKTE